MPEDQSWESFWWAKRELAKVRQRTASSRSQHLSPDWVPGPWRRLAVRVGAAGETERWWLLTHQICFAGRTPLTPCSKRCRGAPCSLPQDPTCCSWWCNWANSPRRTSRLFRGVKEIFGEGATKHTVVIFTRKEDLKGGFLRDFIQGADNRALSELVAACGGRVCAFDNYATGSTWDDHVKELMDLIEGLGTVERGDRYTNRLYSLLTVRMWACTVRGKIAGFQRDLYKIHGNSETWYNRGQSELPEKALIQTALCAQVSAALLSQLFCVFHKTCDFFCCLPFSMCRLFCSLLLVIPKKLLMIFRKTSRLECKTPVS